MSILIKALKQAEREHLARAASSGGTVPEEPESAPRLSAALSLEPVDLQSHGAEPASAHPRLPEAPASEAAAPPAEKPARPDAAAALGRIDAPRTLPAREIDSPAAAAPVPPRTAQAAATARAALAAAAAAAATTNASAPGTLPARTPPAAAEPIDAAGEQRKAARQLLSPAPPGGRSRRALVLVTVAVLALGGAVAGAYWLGLIPDLSLPAPRAGAPASAAPVPAPATLAERLARRSGASPGVTPPAAARVVGTGAPAPVRAATPAAATPTPATAPASAGASGARPRDNAPAGAAAERIHVHGPEVATDQVRALLQMAYDAAGHGDATAAKRAYEQVLDLDHNNGDAWIGLAALAANAGDGAGANRDYRRALEIDPGDTVALGGLLGLQAGGDPQEAEARLRALIVRDGAQPALQAALGKLLARQGRWLDAQETFFQAWTADPTQPDVAFNLAVSLEHIRQPALAAQFYARALDLAQGHAARFDRAAARDRIAALLPVPATKHP
jgi:tetratricopeptide (TPR) repeat protein